MRNTWTTEMELELRDVYKGLLCGDGTLDAFCLKYKKNKQQVCRKARQLGLTNKKRAFSDEQNKRIAGQAKDRIRRQGHPRGYSGHKHTDSAKAKMSEASKRTWQDPNSKVHSESWKQGVSNSASKRMIERLAKTPHNVYSRVKSGTVTIGDKKIFARSSWEANVAAYLQFLKDATEIYDWQHEPDTFWFVKIKRGVRSYKPDFKIFNSDGTFYYEEVKGWMDPKSKTKLNRMRIYYPEVKINVLDQKRYNAIKKMSSLIPQWGLLG
jgi:hypothetical protein